MFSYLIEKEEIREIRDYGKVDLTDKYIIEPKKF